MLRSLWLRTAVVPVALIVFAGAGGVAPLPESDQLVARFTGPTNCGSCYACFAGDHRLPLGGSEEYSAIHSYCVAVTGCPHPLCSGGALNTDQEQDAMYLPGLFAAAVEGDEAAIGNLLATFGKKAHLNLERQALQIEGCDASSFIAHIPLAPKTVAALSQKPVRQGV